MNKIIYTESFARNLAFLLFFIMAFASYSNIYFKDWNKSMANVCIKARPQQKSQFTVVCMLYGYDKFPMNNRIIKLLTSLQNSMPLSDVYFLLSKNTEIVMDLNKEFCLHICYEYVNSTVTKEYASKKYKIKRPFWHWIFAYRYKFYQDFIEAHKEIEHIIFLDDDTLILKELTPIFNQDPDSIHLMNDYFDFSAKKDINYKWTKAVESLSQGIKDKCGLKPLFAPMNSSTFMKEIPLNSGLLIGKREKLLELVKYQTEIALCVDIRPGLCDQGFINYLYYSNAFREHNINIHPHSIHEHYLISCPEMFKNDEFNSTISNQWYSLHHYPLIHRRFDRLNNEIQAYMI